MSEFLGHSQSPSLSQQVAEEYLARFQGVPEQNLRHATSSMSESMGIVLASYLSQGRPDRYTDVLDSATSHPDFAADTLAESLACAEPAHIPKVIQSVSRLDFPALSLESRLHVMSETTAAVQRSGETASVAFEQIGYTIAAEVLFDEIVERPYVDPSEVSQMMHVSSFTNVKDPTVYAGYMTAMANQFIRSGKGDRMMHTGFGNFKVGEAVLVGTLIGFNQLGLTNFESSLLETTASDPNWSDCAAQHIYELLREDKPSAKQLYQAIQPKRADIIAMPELDAEYGKHLARLGEVDAALRVAESLPIYTERVWIILNAARNLAANNNSQAASEILRQAGQFDPLDIEPHTPFADASDDAYDDMPEVDENDIASIDAFNDEASLRAELVSKTDYDLRTEQGYTLEFIADTAAAIGDFELALELFGRSRKYPDQTEKSMAKAAVEQRRIVEYVEAAMNCPTIDDISRPHVLQAALAAFQTRTDRLEPTGEDIASETAITTIIRDYAQQQVAAKQTRGQTSAFDIKNLSVLLAQCGDLPAAEALQAGLKGYSAELIISTSIQYLANHGNTTEATAMYVSSPNRPQEALNRSAALHAIICNSLLLGDEDSARLALSELPDYSRASALSHTTVWDGSARATLPKWLAGFVLDNSKYTDGVTAKATAEAVKRAGMVTRYGIDYSPPLR